MDARLKLVLGAAGALAGLVLLGGGARAAEPPAPAGPMPTIRLGSAGPAVAIWQRVVRAAETGTFDQVTDQKTRAWQASRGLVADGVVGPASWAAAGYQGTAPPKPKPGGGGSPRPPRPRQPPQGADPAPGNHFALDKGIDAREEQIVAHVAAGHVDHEWAPLTWEAGGREVRVDVSRRALALRDGPHRLVVSTTYPTAQRLASMLGGYMLTTRMADEIWRRAPVRLQPITRPWSEDGTMARTSRMIEQSAAIDAAVAGRGGLVANEGKDWVATRRNFLPPAGIGVEKPEGQKGSRHNPANFGWYAPGGSQSPGGLSVIQSVGLAHGMGHADYSQLLRFVRAGSLRIDGAPVDLEQALRDPATSGLLQDEGGTLPQLVHPDLGGGWA